MWVWILSLIPNHVLEGMASLHLMMRQSEDKRNWDNYRKVKSYQAPVRKVRRTQHRQSNHYHHRR